MDKMKNIEKKEKYEESIKELFKEIVSDDFYDTWADTFEVECSTEKQIIITYNGVENIKKFKKKCKKTLVSCVDSVMGVGRKVKIIKKSRYKALNSKMKKNIKAIKFFLLGMGFVCIATAVIVVLCSYIGNRNFRETFYITSSIKVDSRVRVVQLSDLHGASYGKNNEKLIKRVESLEPDIIICTGDMVDSVKEDADSTVALAKALSKIAPSYYIYGNNEVESVYDFMLTEKELDKKFGFTAETRDETELLKIKDSFEEKLESAGIKVLKNKKDTINVGNLKIDIYGVLTSNPSSFWSYSGRAFEDYIYENPDNFKIMAVHEPFVFEEFNIDSWGDLMVAGHTHGGVVRVPVLGPLYTHEGGLFPERAESFVYGRYNTGGSPLIISAGLENLNVLRINNQPELVIIDINKF